MTQLLPERAHRHTSGAQCPSGRGILMAASRDPDAKLTFIACDDGDRERLSVKIPTTRAAAGAVELEGRMLVELHRLPLGPLARTVPRYVRSATRDGLPVLVSTALPGRPMSVAYHSFHHTARPVSVRSDLRLAAGWLAALQAATARGTAPISWADEVTEALSGRWDGHPGLDAALTRMRVAQAHLTGHRTVTTVVHGDYWFGNILVRDEAVSGVVDWEAGSPSGSPLRDLARFVLSYSLYLDRHTRPGRHVPGHPGLRRQGFGAGVAYALLGTGWFPQEARRFLGDGLQRLGLPRWLWYDVALTGVGEVAASANDDDFGAGHLALLASLPCRARGRRP